MLRAFAALALTMIAAPVAAQQSEPSPLERLARADQRLLDIGWRLSTASAGLCPDTRPALGLLLRDVRGFADPEVVRAELGQQRDIAIQAVAAHGPAAEAGLRPDDEVTSLLGTDPNQKPAEPRRDWQRLLALNEAIDAALARHGAIGIARSDEAEWRLDGVAACYARFEVAAGDDAAKSTGTRVILGERWTAGDVSDDALAFLVAHELAHNILKHRLQREGPRGERPSSKDVEREADRLAPWLMARAGFDPAGAILFLETFGPGQDGPLYIGTSHDGWKSRRDQAREQIDIIAAQNAGTSIDWQPYFVEELAAARAAMETSAPR